MTTTAARWLDGVLVKMLGLQLLQVNYLEI